ncbi:hypothetical protein [Thiolapillus brandeum]|uniref:Uncharacterized protein n=1 Tax=Thiolapillus brandeum TaxID=1076588 RepID=A0A7U6GHW0_9GAMM|nr:hypothetical protein [Thiolapillus brandeum]BAO43888.1 hypothetical protein TBH_C0958 [Thiolapillus brandeum]
MKKLIFILFLSAISSNASAIDDIRVMGLGMFPCEFWHTKVFRKATNFKELMQKNVTIYPYSSYDEWLNDKDGKKAFNEASDWISGYFAAAQRFSRKKAKNKNQTTSFIVMRVFEICQKNPKDSFESAVFKAIPDFLQ